MSQESIGTFKDSSNRQNGAEKQKRNLFMKLSTGTDTTKLSSTRNPVRSTSQCLATAVHPSAASASGLHANLQTTKHPRSVPRAVSDIYMWATSAFASIVVQTRASTERTLFIEATEACDYITRSRELIRFTKTKSWFVCLSCDNACTYETIVPTTICTRCARADTEPGRIDFESQPPHLESKDREKFVVRCNNCHVEQTLKNDPTRCSSCRHSLSQRGFEPWVGMLRRCGARNITHIHRRTLEEFVDRW